jgi:hypothetical protein
MIKILNKETRAVIGTISDEDFNALQEQLEGEALNDNDYYINQSTLEYFIELELPQTLIDVLKSGLGEMEEMDIEWVRI